MEIQFFDAGCGDGIHIRFKGDDACFHNILIDGGTERGNQYEKTLKKAILQIIGKNEKIDLWIISHIDDDHIGGMLRLLNDKTVFPQLDMSKTTVWYNSSNRDFDAGIRSSTKKSVRQGIRLRDFLSKNTSLQEFITDEKRDIPFYGLTITILSPGREQLIELMAKWKNEEIKIVKKQATTKKGSRPNDYLKMIGDFNENTFTEDTSEENGSSIAFMISYNGKKFLFSSDSHPSVMESALLNLGYKPGEKTLELAYMQVSHHGSCHNTSDQLLRLIYCRNYIISADGMNRNNLPHKETLARIIRNNPDSDLNFFITQKNHQTESIFRVDGIPPRISVSFPPVQTNALTFNL